VHACKGFYTPSDNVICMKRLFVALVFSLFVFAQTPPVSADMTGGIRGTVVNWTGPWAGAEVRVIWPERSMAARTNGRGEFAILGLQPGISTVEVWSIGYPTIIANVLVCEDATRPLHLVLAHVPPQREPPCPEGLLCTYYTVELPPPPIKDLRC